MMTIFHRLASLLPLLALGACTTVLLPPNVPPVAPKANTAEEAERMLLEATRERAAAEARYAAAEQVCYKRFFVNDCLDAAKEERRERLAFLKALQNEGEYFQRKAIVEERDRKLAQAEKEFQQEQARFAAEPAPPVRAVEPPPPPPPGKLEQRDAERAARAARQAEKDRRKAAEAPAKVAAYEKMKAEAAERQRRVVERQAENARKKAEREAAEKKAAEERAAALKAQQQKK